MASHNELEAAVFVQLPFQCVQVIEYSNFSSCDQSSLAFCKTHIFRVQAVHSPELYQPIFLRSS